MKALFIGGCLLTTKTVEKDQRFIHVLLSGNAGLKIDLARYSSYSLVEEVLSEGITTDVPEAVIFLVRPFPFYTLCKLFPRVPRQGGGVVIKAHPGIFSRKCSNWFTENDRLIVEMDWNPNGTKRSRTHAANLFLGSVFNLDAWAIEYVKNKILALEQVCRKNNSRLLVIGPPNVQNDALERRLLTKLNRELLSSSLRHNISYINLFTSEFPDSFLGPDKVHYTAQGHYLLAKKIEEKILSLF